MSVRIMAVSPPADVSSLKFRGWLQRCVKGVQNDAHGSEDDVVMMVYITPRLRNALPGKRMESMLSELRRRNPSVLDIELHDVLAPLDAQALQYQVSEVTQRLAAVGEFEQWFGLAKQSQEDMPLNLADVVCVVSNVGPANRAMLRDRARLDFPWGAWTVATEKVEGVAVEGPFDSFEEAKRIAQQQSSARFFVKHTE